ncbi:phosphatidate cytidylyltransferase [Rhodocista pekingensis]|uniref:Phosphatidate cytidylyltransferase n=1 Tax=Rhodocista pekingensis TaxID=201185 RepID=A0ABW2KRU2_9PROT
MPSKSTTGGIAGSGHRSAAAEPAPAGARSSDLKTRFLSAIILAPPVLAAVWFGGPVFDALVVLAAALSVREWVRLVAPAPATLMPLLLSLVAVGAVMAADLAWGTATALPVAAAATVALYGACLLAGVGPRALVALTVPYIALACVALMWLRNATGEDGRSLFFFLLLAIWATDIGAYAAGRTIGGPKLAPRVSPKKTWAGLIGGMLAAALVGAGVAFFADAGRPLVAALIAACLAVAGQAGDLFESFMKRRSHVKDSGHLIPGHGGLLDRIDGLIVAAPVFALVHGLAGESLQWW